MRVDQLDSHLARQLAGLYLLHGDEPLLSLEAADAIRSRARGAGFTERSVLIAERGFKWGELHASGASLSLFGDKRIVELRIPTGKPGEEGGRAIEEYCSRLPADTLTLVSLPRLARRDQSATWFSVLSRTGVLVDIYPMERARLPEWIGNRLARQQQRAPREALQFLAECVEGNLLAAHQEIQKLGLLLPEGELDFEQVRQAVLNVARYDAAKLTEAMLAGESARLVRMLEGLRAEGEAAPRVLWIVAEELRAIARVQDGLSQGRVLAELCRENRVWGEPRQTLVSRAAQKFDRDVLLGMLVRAAKIDRIIKGVAKGDAWDELLQLGLQLA